MARTIMVSDEVYDKLKTLKNGSSFSEVITELIDESKSKKLSGLKACFGTIPDDEEWREISKDLKKGWKKLTERYV